METTPNVPVVDAVKPGFSREPWRRLLAISRTARMQAAEVGEAAAPENFAADLVTAWLRVEHPIRSARAVPAGDGFDLWEVLGLRAAVAAIAAVAIVGCLNFGTLREEWNGDFLNLDPTASIFGLSL